MAALADLEPAFVLASESASWKCISFGSLDTLATNKAVVSAYFDYIKANEAFLRDRMRYPDAAFISSDFTVALLKRVQGPYNYLLVSCGDDPEVIGLCGVKGSAATHTVEAGYMIGENWTGKGIVTISLLHVLEEVWLHCSAVHSVELVCAEENSASRAVAARCKFYLDESKCFHEASEAGMRHFVVYSYGRPDSSTSQLKPRCA